MLEPDLACPEHPAVDPEATKYSSACELTPTEPDGEEALSGDALIPTTLQLHVSLARTDAVPEALRQLPADPSAYILASMNIVLVGAGIVPWSTTDGLGYVLGGLPPAMAANGSHGMAWSTHAAEATPTSSPTSTLPGASTPSLAMLSSISLEHASLGARQVFEELSLHVQAEFVCGSADVRPLPWPSFTSGYCCSMSQAVCWKPPWPLPPRQGVSVGIGATLWLFLVVAWLPHWLYFHFLWKPPWRLRALVIPTYSVQLKRGGLTQFDSHSLFHEFGISCWRLLAEMQPISSMVLLLSIFGHSANMLVLDGELLTCGGDFPNLCACNLIDVPVLLGRSCDVVVVQSGLFSSSDWVEQQPWPPSHVQVEFECDSAVIRPSPWPSFLLSNGSSMSCVVCWKPPWPLHPRHDIRCVPATALQEFLTCMMVISVSIVACGLILELAQWKCGRNCWCFLLEVLTLGLGTSESRGRIRFVHGDEYWDSLHELYYDFSVLMALVLQRHNALHCSTWVQSTGLTLLHFCLATDELQVWPLPWPPDHSLWFKCAILHLWYLAVTSTVQLFFQCCPSAISRVLPNLSCGSCSGLTNMSMWLWELFHCVSNWSWSSVAHREEHVVGTGIIQVTTVRCSGNLLALHYCFYSAPTESDRVIHHSGIKKRNGQQTCDVILQAVPTADAKELLHLPSSMGIKITSLSQIKCLQFPWDPGRTGILHRLEECGIAVCSVDYLKYLLVPLLVFLNVTTKNGVNLIPSNGARKDIP